ncbi:CopG family ribbon-helix-helix protein [Arvimicrobium flavum]|uniref:CopG family ribbon-helix-helix protein n=1 Tax=Arvimicrobium flavum TaxID=3393320 RepID=UPI00237A98CE|nr:ribbon-helix-helix protein, CopG family [Mesorhizobium shangrilense]
MTASETFSVRLSPETKRELEEYARATKRSSAFIVKEAVEAHLSERRAYLAAVEEAEREVERGETIPGDEVIDWLRSWGRPDELPAPSARRSKVA